MHEQLKPFCDHESATKWLSRFTAGYGLDRKAMYCLHIINSLIQDGNNVFERIPPEALGGFAKGTRRAVEASIYLRAETAAGSGAERSQSEEERSRKQERLILEYAKKDKCWYGNAPVYLEKRYKKIAEGGEAEVFDAGTHVIKFISNIYFSDYETMLDRVALHNHFSPEIPLSVLGYGYGRDGIYGIVVRQPYVQGKSISEAEIGAHIEGLGFKRLEDIIARTEYVNDIYFLGDMHDENAVLTPEGRVAMFDTDSRLNTPELGYGGKYIIPEVSYSEESVRKIDGIMREVAPVVVPREQYEARFGNARNRLKEQLSQTGRYDGHFFMADRTGRERAFTLQVDPTNKGRLLRVWCDGIDVMLDRDRRFSGEEKDSLRDGVAVRRGDRMYAFDLDSGLVRTCSGFNPRITKAQMVEVRRKDDSPAPEPLRAVRLKR